MAKSKKNMSREEVICWRLGVKMLAMAKEISSYPNLVLELAENNQYLRICGEEYMPVSLGEKSPLSGYGQGKCSNLSVALEQFKREKPNVIDPEILKNKGERRLQSWLIKNALLEDRSLKSCFSSAISYFDELLFALDEVSMGDVNHLPVGRCDLLCVGLKTGSWVPVVVELKSLRQGEKLVKQVTDYAKELASFRDQLDPLLEEITGKSVANSEIHKLVVFPAPKTYSGRVKSTFRLYEDNSVYLVEYDGNCPETFSLFPAVKPD